MCEIKVSENLDVIRSGTNDNVKKLFGTCLTNDEEQCLIDRGDGSLFRRYIRKHGLSISSQLYLVQSSHLDFIRDYMRWYSLVTEAQISLLQQNNASLVRSYIRYRHFSSAPEVLNALQVFVAKNPTFQFLMTNY